MTIVFLLPITPTSTCVAADLPVLVAKRELSILQSPRRGLFCQRGPEIAKFKQGQEISSYENIKSFCGPGFPIEYIKFEHTAADGKISTVYVRRKENDGSDRFSIKLN